MEDMSHQLTQHPELGLIRLPGVPSIARKMAQEERESLRLYYEGGFCKLLEQGGSS